MDLYPGEDGEGDTVKKQALDSRINREEEDKSKDGLKTEDEKSPMDHPQVISLPDIYAAIRRITGSVTRTEEKLDATNLELKKINTQIQGNSAEMKETRKIAENNRGAIEDLYRSIEALKVDVRKTGSREQQEKMERLEATVEKQENYMRKVNLIFMGVPEVEGETNDSLAEYMQSYFKNILGITGVNVDVAHRFGLAFGAHPKKVIVKFSQLHDRERVWKAKQSMKTRKPPPPQSPIRVLMDKSKTTRDRDTISYKIANKAQGLGFRKASYVKGTLILSGVKYKEKDYETLPHPLRPSTLSTPRDQNTLAFYSHYSMLSSHYNAYFEVEGIEYNCVEQFLASERASMAGNDKIKNDIMDTSDPTEHKRFLTSMRQDGQDPEWKRRAKAIAMQGVLAKFSQNFVLRDYLLDTGDRRIGEATPDLFWGTGIALSDPRVLRQEAWKGENTMGEVLQEVRTILMRDA